LLPSVFVAALAGALALAAWGSNVGFAFVAAYAAVIVGFALSRVPRLGAGALRLVLILPTLHVGYGLGFLAGARRGSSVVRRGLRARRERPPRIARPSGAARRAMG